MAVDINAAFARRMQQVQEEFNQMQKVQTELKGDEQKFQSTLKPLQRELETISKQLGAAHAKRKKLQKELELLDDEIAALEQRKADATSKIYGATADAERQRAGKLSMAAGLAGANVGADAALERCTPAQHGPERGLLDLFQEMPTSSASDASATATGTADLLQICTDTACATAPMVAGTYAGSLSKPGTATAVPHVEPAGGMAGTQRGPSSWQHTLQLEQLWASPGAASGQPLHGHGLAAATSGPLPGTAACAGSGLPGTAVAPLGCCIGGQVSKDGQVMTHPVPRASGAVQPDPFESLLMAPLTTNRGW